MTEIGRSLLRLQAWREATADGRIHAYLEGSTFTIVNRARTTLELPLTGTLPGATTEAPVGLGLSTSGDDPCRARSAG